MPVDLRLPVFKRRLKHFSSPSSKNIERRDEHLEKCIQLLKHLRTGEE